MSQKPDTSCLILESRINSTHQHQPPTHPRITKQNSHHTHPHSISSPTHKKNIDVKTFSEQSSSDNSYYNNSPCSLGRVSSFQAVSVKAATELGRVKQENELLKKNFNHEIEFHLRQRMKVLVVVQQLVLANQYQRLLKYVEGQLAFLRKKHDKIFADDQCWKPVLTRDTFIKSTIEDDMTFQYLITNIISNLSSHEKTPNYIPNQLKQLSLESDLTIRRLCSYLEQTPFDIKSVTQCNNLSTKLISDHGLSQGKQLCEFINKVIQQNSKGKYNINMLSGGAVNEEISVKSQLSKLIEENSISKIRCIKKTSM